MEKGPILKLQPGGQSYTMALKYVDYRKSINNFPDQITVKGEVDGQGSGYCLIYLPISQEGKLQQAGVIGAKKDDGSYQILNPGVRVTFSKVQDGSKSHVNCQVVGGAAPASHGAATPSQSQPANNGQAARPTDKRALWESHKLTMRKCIETAEEFAPLITRPLTGDATLALANTLFIQRVRDGLLATPPASEPMITNVQKETIVTAAFEADKDADFVKAELGKLGIAKLEDMTEKQAAAFVQFLRAMQQPPPPAPEDVPF